MGVVQNNSTIESRSRFKFLTGARGLEYPYNLLLLVCFGIIAGISVSHLKLSIGIPGHAIIKIMIPMALGLSLAPAKSAGAIMGISGLITAFIGQTLTEGPGTGTGAYTSLVCTGVLMDLTLYFAFCQFCLRGIFFFTATFFALVPASSVTTHCSLRTRNIS